jgi:hypothetical protein
MLVADLNTSVLVYFTFMWGVFFLENGFLLAWFLPSHSHGNLMVHAVLHILLRNP